VTPQDESLTYRVVGNLEYISALRNLDAFLKNATQEEIQAADEIVKSRPQFAVFSQLAERFRPGNAPPAAGTTGSADSKSQSRFPERRGLMWVVALARLEAGAIIGTFTTIPAPFEVVGPTEYEMPAYKELLMDGAQMHFWGLANDSHLPDVTKSIPGTEMLAYLRRLNLARKMLSAAVRSNAKELTPPQWTQVVEQDQKLLELRDGFEATITAYVISLNRVSQSSSSNTSKVNSVGACGAQLAGERAELRAGTASVQTFDVK
jgi:hypothetical protein